MSAAEKLLNRLHRTKSTGPDRGKAACPLCQSQKGRPLAYKVLPDGRVLLKAFCGCDTSQVMRALGLQMSDLFPECLGEFKPERKPFDAFTVLCAVAHEIAVAHLIADEIAREGHSNPEQTERLMTVDHRLATALSIIGETPVPDEIRCVRRAT